MVKGRGIFSKPGESGRELEASYKTGAQLLEECQDALWSNGEKPAVSQAEGGVCFLMSSWTFPSVKEELSLPAFPWEGHQQRLFVLSDPQSSPNS